MKKLAIPAAVLITVYTLVAVALRVARLAVEGPDLLDVLATIASIFVLFYGWYVVRKGRLRRGVAIYALEALVYGLVFVRMDYPFTVQTLEPNARIAFTYFADAYRPDQKWMHALARENTRGGEGWLRVAITTKPDTYIADIESCEAFAVSEKKWIGPEPLLRPNVALIEGLCAHRRHDEAAAADAFLESTRTTQTERSFVFGAENAYIAGDEDAAKRLLSRVPSAGSVSDRQVLCTERKTKPNSMWLGKSWSAFIRTEPHQLKCETA